MTTRQYFLMPSAKLAAKFRAMAEGLQKEIDAKRGPRLENTPKRQREGMSARIEANRLERTQRAMLALADAAENGGIPKVLEGLKTKAEIYKLVATETVSNGYYHIGDTGKWHYDTPEAKALKALMEKKVDAATKEKDEERKQAERIKQLESTVKFDNIPGFFPTPSAVIDRMLEIADVQADHHVLEPSAGIGHIADRVKAMGVEVMCCELVHKLAEILTLKGHKVRQGDFFEEFPMFTDGGAETSRYDRILMNPPFEKLQDVEHVMHAFQLLKQGGRLVSVMSASPFFRDDGKAKEFRNWLDTVNGDVEDLPKDAFANAFRQTGVAAKLVTIERPFWKEPVVEASPLEAALAATEPVAPPPAPEAPAAPIATDRTLASIQAAKAAVESAMLDWKKDHKVRYTLERALQKLEYAAHQATAHDGDLFGIHEGEE